MTQTEAQPLHSSRGHGAKLWWFAGLVLVLGMVAVVIFEKAAKVPLTPYSAFYEQVEAGNVATVTFQGTDIDGTFKRPANVTAEARNTFRSRVPDFGDPELMPALRKQHVTVNVGSPSQWTRLLAGLPWPMLLFVGAALIAGLMRVLRGGKAQSDSVPTHPMQGLIGMVSGLFGKTKRDADSTPH